MGEGHLAWLLPAAAALGRHLLPLDHLLVHLNFLGEPAPGTPEVGEELRRDLLVEDVRGKPAFGAARRHERPELGSGTHDGGQAR